MLQTEGCSILLRQTTPEDAPVICQAYQNKAFLRLFAAQRKTPNSEEELRRSLQKRSQISPLTLHYIEWLIVHKRHGAIGIVAFNDYSQSHRHAEYSIGLFAEKYCHFGYGIEATLLALELGFNSLNLNKIYSLVYDYNPIVKQILLKGDFKAEGAQENHHAAEKRLVSLYRFSLVREDFRRSKVLSRLSRKLLNRNITQWSQTSEVSKTSEVYVGNQTSEVSKTSEVYVGNQTSEVSKTSEVYVGSQTSEVSKTSEVFREPFSCTHTPEFPNILAQLDCTLALSTYQAGKVILLSAKANGLIQLPRTFKKPMGLAVNEQRLAIATQEEVIVLANAPGLAATYPNQPNTYDGLFIPQATYYTGELDIHDMAYGSEGLWAVNTRFSCLCLLDDKYSFTPRWMPAFLKALTPDDCCHLNGLAMQAGKPRYVTALGKSNKAEGWRNQKGGLLIDVPSSETITQRLAMPHSPRLYDGALYLLNSANGELLQIDTTTGQKECINRLPGFARGMARCGDYLFIGLSKLRRKHNTFGDLPIAKKKQLFCGIVALHLPSGRLAGNVHYLTTCEEIYDIAILPNLHRPGILSADNPIHRHALATPTDCFWSR